MNKEFKKILVYFKNREWEKDASHVKVTLYRDNESLGIIAGSKENTHENSKYYVMYMLMQSLVSVIKQVGIHDKNDIIILLTAMEDAIVNTNIIGEDLTDLLNKIL